MLTSIQDVKLNKMYSQVKFVPDTPKKPEEMEMASTECESEEEKEEEIDKAEAYKTTFFAHKHEALMKYTYYYLAYVCLLESRFQDVITYTSILKREFEPSPEMRFNIALYQTEAYIGMDNNGAALNTLKDTKPSELRMEGDRYAFENSLTGTLEPEQLNPTAIMFLNMASLNFLTDNHEEADTCVQQALTQHGSFGNSDALAYSLIYLNLR